MPVEIRWCVPQRVLYVRYYRVLTIDSIQKAMDETNRLLAEGIPLVHSIMDVTDVESYPKLAELARGLKFEHSDKQGWTIYVGAHGIARFVASVTTQLAGSRFRMYNTFDDALAFLIDQDITLELQKS